MAAVSAAFAQIAAESDFVRRHAFDSGDDDGAYYNFTFGTERAHELWQVIWQSVYLAPAFQPHMAAASMAMCSSEAGWQDYAQLYHWDPTVPTSGAAAL
jgi:hypothetical protein